MDYDKENLTPLSSLAHQRKGSCCVHRLLGSLTGGFQAACACQLWCQAWQETPTLQLTVT